MLSDNKGVSRAQEHQLIPKTGQTGIVLYAGILCALSCPYAVK